MAARTIVMLPPESVGVVAVRSVILSGLLSGAHRAMLRRRVVVPMMPNGARDPFCYCSA